MIKIIEAERLIRCDCNGEKSNDDKEQRRGIIGQTPQMKTWIDAQAQEKRRTPDEQHSHCRKRHKGNQKRLSNHRVHHAAGHSPAPAALAKYAAPLLEIILCHALSPHCREQRADAAHKVE